MIKRILPLFILASLFGCNVSKKPSDASIEKVPFMWENANVYFLLTDRFSNGDPSNDSNFERTKETGLLRGFMGGDFRGIINKINDGYFTKLGVNALWFSPIAEQIHGSVNEGTGNTYGYHGYWAKDWTSIDPNWGTEAEFAELVEAAHAKGIRIVMDVVINHTGPVTEKDPVYNQEWVRTGPQCKYDTYENTVTCTLVENLPDIKTESNEEVDLPDALIEKWEKEGRLQQEMDELNAFFAETGYPRAPRFYIMKWLIDFVKNYGVDGYRIDTAKHTEESIWAELNIWASKAFLDWKAANPEKVLDNNDFYTVGEVYNYNAGTGRMFDNGGVQVDYYSNGMDALINFGLKVDAQEDYEVVFSKYSQLLNNELKGQSILNYMTSHDDGQPFDKEREKSFKAANMLLLCPGASQIYYGDETNRDLTIEGTVGDATLRSFMNWEDIESNANVHGVATKDLLSHYQKLGQFRAANPAVGAGVHTQLLADPYIFKRELVKGDYSNKVVVGIDMNKGLKEIPVKDIFEEGQVLTDYYSGKQVKVEKGIVSLNSENSLVLLSL
ncbi:alpha-amylase family glycosyl hydrolase [Plebeiibacterium marinum]|uniref:Alpha-amylase n=1 Tax=Plebeiibacterium marinum TaxID=2992111 RepID=A0AAE3SL75_9BACT|nr:alpha-amylase family glycosyl hydrolase [Plebeiobacterium marinum]MCW3807144.1 alpha-amylase family glycosyl hydrolase [Plebeiobacterium marinum]